MREPIERVQISVDMMPTFVAMPAQNNPKAIILYMDVWSIRDALHAIEHSLADQSYARLVPDFLSQRLNTPFFL